VAGAYRVDREIGAGGMATVYLAEDLKHRRQVAIKVLRPELAVALGGDRFLREIETTASLNHPHILGLLDSGRAGDLLYYVMPFVEGESLRDQLQREKQLPVEEAVRIAREVAGALGFAHRRGIVHRDIKPENILLQDGHAVVADFGIAKAVTVAGGESLTRTGMAIGTPQYMSPEQSTAETVDGRTDLYALGCVLYEMLAGEPPFTGPSGHAILAKRMREPAPRVSVVRETVSTALEQVLNRALAKAPADRFRTAEDFISALDDPSASLPVPESTGRRRVGLRALAALAVAAAAVGGFFLFRPRSVAPAVSMDRLVVVPFTVRGQPEFEYLGEGMVDLISAKLDGAGGLTAVNPRAVISLVTGEKIDVRDPAAGRRVAEGLGAGRYVTGDVTEVGGRIQLTAYLHSTGAVESPPARTSAEGEAASLFAVIDTVAFGLLGATVTDSLARLQKLATTVSTSLPALKEYLLGERLIRSGGRYQEASDAYERAIALDTAFALAYYRKSLVAEWIDAYDVRSSAEKASRYAARLSARDRSLLAALRLRRRGETAAAERAYRAHLHSWPDEVEAMVQMGEILFHDNPRRGRPMDEAIPMFQAALAIEPANADARIHLARLYALYNQLDSLESDVRHFEQEAAAFQAGNDGPGEKVFEVEAIRAYAARDTAAQRDLLARLRGKPWPYWFFAAHGVSRFSRDAAGAEAMLAQRESDEKLLLNLLAGLYLVRGQHQRFRGFMDSLPGGRTPIWDLMEAYVWTSGALAPETARMRVLSDRLRRADPAELRADNMVPAYEDLTVPFHRFERDYQVALLLIQLGRRAEAERIMISLRTTPSMEGLGNLQPDAILGLTAEIQLEDGDSAGALSTLRSMTYEAPHGATYHAIADGSRSRFLQAELEFARGDTTVAWGLYRGFDESWSPWDMYHRAVAYRRLGEIAEARRHPAEAITYYSRLIDLWRDCDPELVPHREEILRRRDALIASTG
jgi:serine/threonine-protein kinase